MTDPPQPATRLDDARAALHQAAVRVLAACGWGAERAHLRPPATLTTPGAFVGTPTLHPGTSAGARLVAATFPAWFVVDGGDAQQLEQVDRLLAYGWAELAAVRIGTEPDRLSRVTVLSGGPEDVDVGGAATRAVVFRVQCTLLVATLCGRSITPSSETEG